MSLKQRPHASMSRLRHLPACMRAFARCSNDLQIKVSKRFSYFLPYLRKFLVACLRLLKPLCRLIGWSVHLSIIARSTRLTAIGPVCVYSTENCISRHPHAGLMIFYTFFSCKNHVYKNVKAKICLNFRSFYFSSYLFS